MFLAVLFFLEVLLGFVGPGGLLLLLLLERVVRRLAKVYVQVTCLVLQPFAARKVGILIHLLVIHLI